MILCDSKIDTGNLQNKDIIIDSEAHTSLTEYLEISREEPIIIENLKYQTFKDGVDPLL